MRGGDSRPSRRGRSYRVLGAKTLGADAQWEDVTDKRNSNNALDYGAEEGCRFFKVEVDMPY